MEWNWSLILNGVVCLVSVLLLTFCVPLLKARLGEARFQALQNFVAAGFIQLLDELRILVSGD